jgi:hypothetical protein
METNFKAGDRVTVLNTHWDRSVHGQTGKVYSVTISAENLPTCYVKLATRGQWVLASELVRAS